VLVQVPPRDLGLRLPHHRHHQDDQSHAGGRNVTQYYISYA
jgi:hypothetical protein